jgi:tRNA (cytidine/uridine-2'-O-)-methyltransferase
VEEGAFRVRGRALGGGPAGGRATLSLHIALIEPQIPPNTGNIARLCAATETSLHLIEPIGFSLDDADLRRAGVDYWDAVDLWVHPGWRYFREAFARERCWYFSTRGAASLWDARIPDGSCLVFGNETAGLPERIMEKYPERVYRIPMTGPVRSLNLSTAAGIALYHVLADLRSESTSTNYDRHERAGAIR